MLTVKCPLCGHDQYKSVFKDFGYDKRDHTIVRCLECGFCYTNPQPSDDELNQIYKTYYGTQDETEKTKEALRFRKSVFEETCQLIGPAKKKTLLDVGCGNG